MTQHAPFQSKWRFGLKSAIWWFTITLLVSSSGCSPWQLAKRTLFTELNQFPRVTDGRLSCLQYSTWAKREWKRIAAETPDQDFSSDYVSGFVQGFSSYVYAGGKTEPPAIPPQRYWRLGYRNTKGDQAVKDWYKGFARGSEVAKERGYRDRAIIPSSVLLGYNVKEENPWYAPSGEGPSDDSSDANAHRMLEEPEEKPERMDADTLPPPKTDPGPETSEGPEIEFDPRLDWTEQEEDTTNNENGKSTEELGFPFDLDNEPDDPGIEERQPEDETTKEPTTEPDEETDEAIDPNNEQSLEDLVPELSSRTPRKSSFDLEIEATPPKQPWLEEARTKSQMTMVVADSKEIPRAMQKTTVVTKEPDVINSKGFVPVREMTLVTEKIVPARTEINEPNNALSVDEQLPESAWKARD